MPSTHVSSWRSPPDKQLHGASLPDSALKHSCRVWSGYLPKLFISLQLDRDISQFSVLIASTDLPRGLETNSLHRHDVERFSVCSFILGLCVCVGVCGFVRPCARKLMIHDTKSNSSCFSEKPPVDMELDFPPEKNKLTHEFKRPSVGTGTVRYFWNIRHSYSDSKPRGCCGLIHFRNRIKWPISPRLLL